MASSRDRPVISSVEIYFDDKKSFASLTWSTYIQMDKNFHGNNYTFAMATPLDIQYKLVEKLKNTASDSRLGAIREQLRNFFTEITRRIFGLFRDH